MSTSVRPPQSVTSDPATQAPDPTSAPHRTPGWKIALNIGGPLVYAAALAVYIKGWGLPLARDTFAIWLLVGLLSFSLTDVKGWLWGLVVDWIPMFAILLAYDLLRGYSTKLFSAHVLPQLDFDRWLFGGHVPTLWLQQHLFSKYQTVNALGQVTDHLHWWDYLTWATYMSHFFVTFVVLAFLWKRNYPRFLEYRAMVVTLFMAGLATYALFPAVPPWMAADEQHRFLPVDRLVGIISGHMGVKFAATLFEKGSQYSNDVAAMPSLHCAFPMLLALFCWGTARWWVRIPLALYPLCMAFALTYGAEHYIADELAGWVYAIVTFMVVKRIFAWRTRRNGFRPGMGSRSRAHEPGDATLTT